jgi:hypothetical protein
MRAPPYMPEPVDGTASACTSAPGVLSLPCAASATQAVLAKPGQGARRRWAGRGGSADRLRPVWRRAHTRGGPGERASPAGARGQRPSSGSGGCPGRSIGYVVPAMRSIGRRRLRWRSPAKVRAADGPAEAALPTGSGMSGGAHILVGARGSELPRRGCGGSAPAKAIVSNKFHRLWRLSWAQRRQLAWACLLLPPTALALRWLGFVRTRDALARLFPLRQPPACAECATTVAEDAARLVAAAARHGLYRATCLPQSLVLWGLLRRLGIDSELRVGVRTTDGRLDAHAWVERDGIPLNDTDDVHQRFPAFPQGLASSEADTRC